jgi:hypothetical protein
MKATAEVGEEKVNYEFSRFEIAKVKPGTKTEGWRRKSCEARFSFFGILLMISRRLDGNEFHLKP